MVPEQLEDVVLADARGPAPGRGCSQGGADLLCQGVGAITRVATPGREADLLEFVQASSAAKLERAVRLVEKLYREGELTVEEAGHSSRTFSVFVDGGRMYAAEGRIEPEAGAVLMRAVEAASAAGPAGPRHRRPPVSLLPQLAAVVSRADLRRYLVHYGRRLPDRARVPGDGR